MTQSSFSLDLANPDATTQLAKTIAPRLGAGDVLLFNGQCWHAGGANQTEENRYAVFAHYRKSMLIFQLDPHDEFPSEWYDQLNPRQRELLRMQKGVGALHSADGHFEPPPER